MAPTSHQDEHHLIDPQKTSESSWPWTVRQSKKSTPVILGVSTNNDNRMERWTAEETKAGVEIKVGIPGLGRDDVQVTLEEKNAIFIKSKEENAVNPISYKVDRNILKVNETKVEMKNGVLKIFVPKILEEEIIKVEVE